MSGAEVPGVVDVRRVGAGGAGQVFRGRQPAFDREVAVKVLDGRVDDEATERRFRRECRVLGSLAQHPNIVTVLDAGVTDAGRPYLVMPFLARGSLLDEVERCGRLPWQQVVEWGVQLAGALHTAHLAGILHRDLKPGNVLLSEYGEPMLADFGIALDVVQQAGTTTASSITPAFCAPELLGSAASTVASDVYGLAATLWTALAGRGPFERTDGRPDSMVALLARVVTDRPPDLRPLGVPASLAGLLDAGLAKDPAQRPSSALAFAEALQHVERSVGKAVTSIPVPKSGRTQSVAAASADVPAGPSQGSVPLSPAYVTPPPRAQATTPPRAQATIPPPAYATIPPPAYPAPVPAPPTSRPVASRPVGRRWVLGAGALVLGAGSAAGGFWGYYRFWAPGGSSRETTATRDEVPSWPEATSTWPVKATGLAPRVRVCQETGQVYVLADRRTLIGRSLQGPTEERRSLPQSAATYDVEGSLGGLLVVGQTAGAHLGELSIVKPWRTLTGWPAGRVNDVRLTSNGVFAACEDGMVRHWPGKDPAEGPRVYSLGSEVAELTGDWSSEIAARLVDGSVRVVNTSDGVVGEALDARRPVAAVAISSLAGTILKVGTLATVDVDGNVRLWNSTGILRAGYQTIRNVRVAGMKVAAVTFDPSGKRLAAIGDQPWIAILDAATGELVATAPTASARPTAIHWSLADPAGQSAYLAVLDDDRTVRLWRTPGGG